MIINPALSDPYNEHDMQTHCGIDGFGVARDAMLTTPSTLTISLAKSNIPPHQTSIDAIVLSLISTVHLVLSP
jgi:hypothetical protein